MLRSLSVRDVVLIGRLDIALGDGLCVLTGETGAGKSILLDSLGLALGVRAEQRLVRHGADQASVTAAFDLPDDHDLRAVLAEQGLDDGDGTLILRRILGKDGRSRAFVNDQPVSVSLLRRLGDALVEVHGQFESQRLLDPSLHRGLLDSQGGLGGMTAAVRAAHQAWKQAGRTLMEAEAAMEQARRDEEFLRHALGELEALAPEEGEEENLARERTLLQHGEKLLESMNQAAADLNEGKGVESTLQSALRALERVADKAEGRLDDCIATLNRAAEELAEGTAQLDRALSSVDLDPRHLERVEERLFALRALARKHDVEVDALPALQVRMADQLAALEDGGANLDRLRKAEAEARTAYAAEAEKLSAARAQAAKRLDAAMTAELEPLRLGKAHFLTRVERLDESGWTENGMDRIAFEVATNPGAPPGPLNKIASGGELARFMLALKAVLASADPVPTLVFDEVDAGIGGATASAVGERLAGLARDVQVLVVTHSPQVAAVGKHHWRVSKTESDGTVLTSIEVLDEAQRREEIARMLAGAEITDEARAAAVSLLGGTAS